MFPLAVQADDLSAFDRGHMSYGAGVFVGYQWGPRSGVEWGLEAFATYRFTGLGECVSEPRAGFGPLLQFAMLGARDPRVTLAAQAGLEGDRGLISFRGEGGGTYRFGEDPGFGVHLGLGTDIVIASGALRYQALRDELWLGGGVRFLPTFGEPSKCAIGRPLRADQPCDPLQPPDESAALLALANGASRAELAGYAYARDAQLECASVPAFLQLAAELFAHAAPPSLIERALDAACDEITHAHACAAMASSLLHRTVRPSWPAIPARRVLPGVAGLQRLAAESWFDGCLGEGLAAREAAHGAELASEPAARKLQRRIARDEHRHAELAWSVLEWAAASGGEPVREHLRTAIATAARAPNTGTEAQLAPSGLERYGRLGHDRRDALYGSQFDRSVQRWSAGPAFSG